MSTEENKTRVHRFYEEVFNRKNTAALDEFIDSQAVDHAAPAGAPGGIEGARQFAAMFLAAFPDVRFTVEDLIAEGDRAVARLTQSGTHHGIFLGLPQPGSACRSRASKSSASRAARSSSIGTAMTIWACSNNSASFLPSGRAMSHL